MNVRGNHYEEEYLITHKLDDEIKANKIFKITIKITLLIYIYFLYRNYEAYKNISSDKKNLYFIKVYGSCFLLAGAICLLYFQEKQTTFIGGPAT